MGAREHSDHALERQHMESLLILVGAGIEVLRTRVTGESQGDEA
jgi:hypothetical protein